MKVKSKTKRLLSTLKLKQKASQEKEKSFQCWCCLKTFKEEHLRRQHMRIHDPARLTFSCNQCQLLFPSRIAYNKHLQSEHQKSSILNEFRVFDRKQTVSSAQQRPGNENDLYDFSKRNPSASCQEDLNLRIESTFSLGHDEFREMSTDTWPVEFIDINTDLESIEQQQFPDTRYGLMENELENVRIQDQQKQDYYPSSTMMNSTNQFQINQFNSIPNDDNYLDLTLESDEEDFDFENYQGDDDDEGSGEEISIYDVHIVEDADDYFAEKTLTKS